MGSEEPTYIILRIKIVVNNYYPQFFIQNMSIAKNLKKYRKQKGISQDKLSKLADVTYNTIIKLESGATKNPRVETLQLIAKALGVGVDDLLK